MCIFFDECEDLCFEDCEFGDCDFGDLEVPQLLSIGLLLVLLLSFFLPFIRTLLASGTRHVSITPISKIQSKRIEFFFQFIRIAHVVLFSMGEWLKPN